MVYGVFRGCYSDWYIVGYFNDRELADKYCCVYGNGDYYVQPMKDLTDEKDLSIVHLNYAYEIMFNFSEEGTWVILEDPDRYNCYIDNSLHPDYIKYGGARYKWVSFHINLSENNYEKAKKIAQDYLYELLAYGEDRQIHEENVELMNNKFIEPFRIAKELKEQEELKQKELAELKRLKEKYEM